jgi:hypothetical protein
MITTHKDRTDMDKKYGGYTAAELREMLDGNGYGLDALTQDDGTCAAVIEGLLDALSAPAEATQAGAVPPSLYFYGDHEHGFECPDDAVIVSGRKLGDRFTLNAAWYAPVQFEVVKVPDDVDDDYAVREVLAAAPQPPVAEAARECRHCGWMCLPNSTPSKSSYPLAARAHQPARASEAGAVTYELKRIGYATFHHEMAISVRLDDPTPVDFIDGYSGKDVFVLAAPAPQPARASEAGEAIGALLAKVPRKPNAITYEKGWELLDELQRIAESFEAAPAQDREA